MLSSSIRRGGSVTPSTCALSPRPTSFCKHGAWADEAFARRVLLSDPLMGSAWVASREDLLLAKVEWSEGDLTGLQGRDARAITAASPSLDVDYLRRHATSLGIGALLEQVLDDDA